MLWGGARPTVGALLISVGQDAATAFGTVADAALFQDGTLAVLDSQARHVALFAPDGSAAGVLSGPGEGPGEIRRAFRVGTTSRGELWVWDNLASAVSVFTRSGDLVRTIHVTGADHDGRAVDAVLVGDSMLAVTLSLGAPAGPAGPGRQACPVRISRRGRPPVSRRGWIHDARSRRGVHRGGTAGRDHGSTRVLPPAQGRAR